MKTDRELMQMALDALDSDNPHIQVGAAITLRYRLAQPDSWPYTPEQLKQKPCETGSQCIGGKCPECTNDDGDEMCETCDCWKKTRTMCS